MKKRITALISAMALGLSAMPFSANAVQSETYTDKDILKML